MTAGRPLKFATAEELQAKINEYFATCLNEDGSYRVAPLTGQPIKPPTITGLALHLDTSRETLCNYEKRDEFFDTVKRAKTIVEEFYESRLCYNNATGPIFALKNFGWSDKQDLNLGGQKDNPMQLGGKIEIVHVKP